MAQYLSDEWFDEMQSAAAAYVPDEEMTGRVSLQETVTGSPSGDVSWTLVIEDGKVTFARDGSTADVSFRQDYETAVALHQQEITIQEAFFAGRVRVAGHLNTLLEHASLLQGIAPAFSEVRERTTY